MAAVIKRYDFGATHAALRRYVDAGLPMTQRHMAFWHPFSFEFKQQVYRAVGR